MASRASSMSSRLRVRTPGQRAADADDRLAELEQARRLVGGELERDRDDGVDALAQQEVLEHAAALVGAAAEVVEGQVVALLEQRALGALDHGAEEPAVEERDDDADVAGASGREAGGARRDDVAELVGGRDHAIPGRGRHRSATAQGARDRRRGDSRGARDLVDARHDASCRGCGSQTVRRRPADVTGTVARLSARSRRSRDRPAAATDPAPVFATTVTPPERKLSDIGSSGLDPLERARREVVLSTSGDRLAVELEGRPGNARLRVARVARPAVRLRQPAGVARAEAGRRGVGDPTGSARGIRPGRSSRRRCG